MEQSLELRQAVAESPIAKECESQMNQGNNLLRACRYATETATRLDQHTFMFNYRNIPTPALKEIYSVYTVIRHLLYPYFSASILPPNSLQNEVQISAKVNNNSSALSVAIQLPIMDINFTDVRLCPLAASLLQLNPNSNALDRIAKQLSPLYSQRKYILSSRFIFSTPIKKMILMLNSLQGIYRIHVSIILQKCDLINITRSSKRSI
jgi:hypothetical protein